VSVEQFLKQRAVKVMVAGSYTLPNWYDPQGKLRTFACRTTRVSPFRMIVEAPVIGKVGTCLTSYFRDFGKFDANITEAMRGSFLLELQMAKPAREKFATKLTWLEKKHKDPTVRDVRKDVRIVPANSHSILTMADGRIYECFVIDICRSGVAVSALIQPPIGTPLAVGACVGRVVRLLPDGFAVQFIEPQNLNHLEQLIARTAPAKMKLESA
jgi:hypothetical protein